MVKNHIPYKARAVLLPVPLNMSILHEGRLLNPLIIWNGFILDGNTRYRILRKHPFIAFQIQEIELDKSSKGINASLLPKKEPL